MALTFEQIKDRLGDTLQDPEGAGSDLLTGTIDLSHLNSDALGLLTVTISSPT